MKHYKFVVTYPSGLVDEEIVQDCNSVEAYINRKFGSSPVNELDVKVTMVSLAEDNAAEVTKDSRSLVMKVETGAVGAKLDDK